MFSNPKFNAISDALRRNAEMYPDRMAIVSGETRLTYDALNKRVNRLANSLKAKGVTRGTGVACIAKNRHELLETLLAANKIGATYVPLNYRLASEEVRYIIENSEAKVFVFDPAFVDIARAVLAKTEGLDLVISLKGGPEDFENFEKLIEAGDESEPGVELSRDDLIWIAYTSGTTGFPKGVMSTNGQILDICPDHPVEFASAWTSSAICAPPLYGAGALGVPMQMIYCCGKMVLLDFDPVAMVKAIEKEKIEIFPGVPIMVKQMMAVPDFEKYDTSSLRHFLFGGGHLNISLVRELRESFNCHFQADYAMTEIGGGKGTVLSHFDLDTDAPLEMLNRITSAGRPRKGVDLKILNDEGIEVEVGGEVGEILLKTPGVMKGYWKNPEATAKSIQDGWLRTGDMGWIDEQGYVYIVDRLHDTIKSGAANVYPAEVEIVLIEHPAVAEVAVFATPDEKWGELVTALVVLKPGMEASPEELTNFCQDKIAGYKKPRKIIYTTDPLPRNGLGKVLRKHLRQQYANS